MQGGVKAEINAGVVLRRRLTVTGSTLRPRPIVFKAAIAQALKQHVWPLIESGTVKPVIHSVFAAVGDSSGSGAETLIRSGAAEAHTLMESNQHIGKIVLTWSHAG